MHKKGYRKETVYLNGRWGARRTLYIKLPQRTYSLHHETDWFDDGN